MYEQILPIFQWWFILFFLGVTFFPLSYFLFPHFIDKGYGLSKTLALVLFTYFVFILGTSHFFTFNTSNLFFILFLIVIFLILILRKKFDFLKKNGFFSYIKNKWKFLLLEELLFLIIFIFWCFIRSHNPDINGLEKFMDYGFINSILRSDYFPAKDMWLTPFTINYYYYGHFATAVLTKLSLLPSNITYNLMLATLAGLCFSSCFSLGSTLLLQGNKLINRTKTVVLGGILTALLTTFGGNLHSIYAFFSGYSAQNPVPFWHLIFSPSTFPNNYWYPNATRFIYNTIHEFPIYSWVVSDLHGHVFDIPFVLLTISFLLSFFLIFNKKENNFILKQSFTSTKKKNYFAIKTLNIPFIGSLFFISFLLSILYMTNAWDGLIYFLLTILLLLFLLRHKMYLSAKKTYFENLVNYFNHILITIFILILGFIIFSLPFSLFFKPFVSGIGILCAPSFLTNIGSLGPFLFEANHCQHSPLWQLLILHGFFYIFIILFFILIAKSRKISTSDIFILLLIITSTLLIIIPEFLYIKDIYPAHYRANTMFKLVFQSFIMLSISTGYIIIRLIQTLKKNQKRRYLYHLFILLMTPLFSLIFIYPYFAITSYYGELLQDKGLDGTMYLQKKYPSDAAAISWIQKNINKQPVILEAQGDSYTDYGRVSANTGLPTVLGWTVHEWLWRGTYDIPAPRIEEIKKMYESSDLQLTKKLLKKYNIRYVFLGDLEREKYPKLNEKKFGKLGMIIFQKDETKIIRLH